MASGTVPHLISVVKYNKYALFGVLGFYAKGVIFYMRTSIPTVPFAAVGKATLQANARP